LEIFRGTLPPQHSARKDDCLSAKREFRLCSEARRRRVEKYPACGGIAIFKSYKGSPIQIAGASRRRRFMTTLNTSTIRNTTTIRADPYPALKKLKPTL